jgi:hypothetical protein
MRGLNSHKKPFNLTLFEQQEEEEQQQSKNVLASKRIKISAIPIFFDIKTTLISGADSNLLKIEYFGILYCCCCCSILSFTGQPSCSWPGHIMLRELARPTFFKLFVAIFTFFRSSNTLEILLE